jgi:diaminopimelate decarboxylase
MSLELPWRREEVPSTPFYLYDLEVLRRTLSACADAAKPYNYHIHYAVKANANDQVLKVISDAGFGADCVSGQEVEKAIEAGFSPAKIAFAGVGKSDEEIKTGLQHNIFTFNVESIPELEVINEIAERSGKIAQVAIRVNPDVKANTHKYITTGLEENKFGINPWEFPRLVELIPVLKHVKVVGLHVHIGSQIMDLSAFKHMCLRVNEIQGWFIDHRIRFEHINLGGGLGVNYENPSEIPDFVSFFSTIHEFLEPRPNQEIHFELGRALVAHMGDLITRVLYVKEGLKKKFAIVDAGMTELIRPALYQAYHRIDALHANSDTEKYDVVGPICESSDIFGKEVELPKLKRGDLVAIRSAGAYGEVMASRYNLRPFAKAYLNHE